MLRDQFEMYGFDIKPGKANGMRWLDHRLRAMQKLADEFGLYTQHIQNVIADTSKTLDRATLQGKYNKLIDAKVLLRGSLLIDILAEAKKFSLTSQKTISALMI